MFFLQPFFLQCSDRRLHAKPEASNPSASVSCRALGLGFKVQQWDWVTMTWRKMGIPWNHSHPKPSFVKDRWPALLVPTVSHANGLHHQKASNYGHEGTSCHNEMCVQHYLLQKQRQGMRGKLHKKKPNARGGVQQVFEVKAVAIQWSSTIFWQSPVYQTMALSSWRFPKDCFFGRIVNNTVK